MTRRTPHQAAAISDNPCLGEPGTLAENTRTCPESDGVEFDVLFRHLTSASSDWPVILALLQIVGDRPGLHLMRGLDFEGDPHCSSSNRVGLGLHINRLIDVLAVGVGFGHEPEVAGLELVPAAAVRAFRPDADLAGADDRVVMADLRFLSRCKLEGNRLLRIERIGMRPGESAILGGSVLDVDRHGFIGFIGDFQEALGECLKLCRLGFGVADDSDAWTRQHGPRRGRHDHGVVTGPDGRGQNRRWVGWRPKTG